MVDTDALLPISEENIPNLLKVLKQDMPYSTVVYHWIRVQIEWSRKIPGVTVHILCPERQWQDGTVLAFTDGLALEGKKYGVVYAREGRGAQLAAALRATRAVPWHDMLHFSGVLERHVDMLRSAATAAGVKLPPQHPLCHLLHFPDDLIALIKENKTHELPENSGLRISRLNVNNLDEAWQLRLLFPECYKPVIGACLEHNICIGVFVTRPDGTEVLASMVMQTPYGGMGMGQTHPDYLHSGCLTYAIIHSIRSISEAGFDVHGHVATNNEVMVDFSQKYGIDFIEKTARVDISPGVINYKAN